MKPNSSWSLRQNGAKPEMQSGAKAGGAGGGRAEHRGPALVEQRLLWFLFRAPEKRASAADLATGLDVEPDVIRQALKLGVRKGLLREIPKSADRPAALYAVAQRAWQEATALAAGPDPGAPSA